MNNPQIIQILDEIADMLEVQGVDFKPQAYRKVARSIEAFSTELKKYYQEKGLAGLKDIPGVGDAIALKLEELIKTGKLKYYEDLKKQIPKGILELMAVHGIGPKKAAALYYEQGIHNRSELKQAAETHKLETLPGFGEKSEELIKKTISEKKKDSDRLMLQDAMEIAESVKLELDKSKLAKKLAIVGSLARMKETIGDIDILAISDFPEKLIDYFVTLKGVSRVLAKGPKKASVVLKGTQVDLRVFDQSSFGAATQYFVGSKLHNVAVRKIAIKNGFKLNEYGLYDKSENLLAGKDEKEIYVKLGMQWVPFELRENTGEIEAALNNKLPKLVELKDIKGDLHVHSKYSADAHNTISEMANKAKSLGYEYIAITDHSSVNPDPDDWCYTLTAEAFFRRQKEIDKLNRSLKGFTMLSGIEANMDRIGNLGLSKDILESADIVIASIHPNRFNLTKKQQTDRIINAIHSGAKLIAHPHLGYGKYTYQVDFDLDDVLDAAKEQKVALEISPKYSDLNSSDANAAVKKGVLLSIDTDSHTLNEFGRMRYGVGIARRAWCEKKDILNTRTLKELKKILKRN